jgi:hypothetical protein
MTLETEPSTQVRKGLLPNFFVIGAGKAGTTSLHSYLALNPAIHMSKVKEPNFFTADDPTRPHANGRMGDRATYEAMFVTDKPLRGESSTSYTVHPLRPGVPGRIHALVPEARFVYVVRDPVERTISHYMQAFNAGYDDRSLDEALADLDDDVATRGYVAASRYATQLDQYLQFFDLERIYVVDQARLAAETAQVVDDIAAFLGAPPTGASPEAYVRLNETAAKRRASPVLRKLRSFHRARAFARETPVLRKLTLALREVLSSPTEKPQGSPELRARLADHLRPEAQRLREMTGQEFSSWSV